MSDSPSAMCLVPEAQARGQQPARQAATEAGQLQPRRVYPVQDASAGEVLGIVYPMRCGKWIEGDVFDEPGDCELIVGPIRQPRLCDLVRRLAYSPLGALVARKPMPARRASRRRHGGQWRKRREMQ